MNLQRRALAAGALTAAMLGFATTQAMASYTATVDAGGTLRIQGNNAADKLAIAPTPDSVVLDVGEDGTADFTIARSAFNSVQVDAGGGADEVRILNAATPLPNVIVDGDGGDDTLLGANGAETFSGGSGNDFVDGNIGADSAKLGPGNDTFQWDPGDGSDVVDGESGDDTLAFNGSNIGEKIQLASNGATGARLTRDVAAIDMDLEGMEDVNVRALGGADTVTVDDLSNAGIERTDVDLAGFDGTGDAAADNVVVDGTPQDDQAKVSSSGAALRVQGPGTNVFVTGGEPADVATFAGQDGDDTLQTSVATANPMKAAFDGGAGTDHTRYDGSNGADAIGIARDGLNAVATFGASSVLLDSLAVEDLTVSGLGGADAITGQNGIGTLTHLTEDGGSGDDTLRGGDGADLLLGGTGNDLVDGNIGADTLQPGSGNDTVQWDPGDGSDVADGGSGSDTLQFNGSNAGEKMHLFADGNGGAVFTRDVAAITLGLQSIEAVNVRALGSADTVTVDDLTGTGIARTDVDLGAFDGTDDGAIDSVVVNGTAGDDEAEFTSANGELELEAPGADVAINHGTATDSLRFAGGEGADEVTTGVGVENPAHAAFDGGPGTDEAYYDGTSDPDNIGVARDGADQVAAFADGGVLLDNTGVEELDVRGFAGADSIIGQNGIGLLTHLTEDGGSGDDTLAGGDGADLLLGGPGNDHVDGNIGADTAQLGSGNDTFQWDPGDGSDPAIDGQGGDDTLQFNGSNIGEAIDLATQDGGLRLFRNVAAVTLLADNVEHANVRVLGGADVTTVNDLTGSGVKTVGVDLGAFDGTGDAAGDTVVQNGTAGRDKVSVTRSGATVLSTGLAAALSITGSEPANDLLRVNTQAGTDTVTVAPDVAGLMAVATDLGAQ